MVANWQPATGLERTLFEAIQQGDQERSLRLLAEAVLLVPVQQDANGRTTGWVTSTSGGRTYLSGYTAKEALAGVAAGRQVSYLTTSLAELASRWPDPGWWLAVNPGLPIEALVSPDYLAQLRLPAPTRQAQPAPAGQLSAATTDTAVPEADMAAAGSDSVHADRADDIAAGVGSSKVAEIGTDESLVDEIPDLADPERFQPANEIEISMLEAAGQGDADAYLKALIIAELVVPESGSSGGEWPRILISGRPAIPLFTSVTRYQERYGYASYRLVEAIAAIQDWPGVDVALALNAGTPVGAHLPGEQVIELAEWAAEIGLLDVLDGDGDSDDGAVGEDSGTQPETPPNAEPGETPEPVGWLQKLLPHEHVDIYQQRGYHLVSGTIHRLEAVGEGIQPARLYQILGLHAPESVFAPDDAQVHALRWPGYGDGRYGDAGLPLGAGAVSQTRVAGVPLPHGALLVRIDQAGQETVVATFDADFRQWRPTSHPRQGGR